jgi:hypothetical protein
MPILPIIVVTNTKLLQSEYILRLSNTSKHDCISASGAVYPSGCKNSLALLKKGESADRQSGTGFRHPSPEQDGLQLEVSGIHQKY